MAKTDIKHMKPYFWAVVIGAFLVLYLSVSMLVAFVIPYNTIPENSDDVLVVTAAPTHSPTPSRVKDTTPEPGATPTPVPTPTPEPTPQPTTGITENAYYAPGVSIRIETLREYDTTIYLAEVIISDISHLKTGFANGTFGRNITQKTSVIAKENGAIFAINGDYYGFRDLGLVQRNGKIYRVNKRTGTQNDILVIYNDGLMAVMNEASADLVQLAVNGSVHVFSFGPALVDDDEILVTATSEVEIHAASNPRTAIGMVEPFHYYFLVSDGRTSESKGLTLFQVAAILRDSGCKVAYNLDGGGSATMVFNGKVINQPTTDGINIKERYVSDIVYIK